MKITTSALIIALAATGTVAAIPFARAEPLMVQLAANQQDDTNFLFLLGMLEGHLKIGHELLQADKAKLAQPHFGHPVRELYDDLKDYIAAKRVPQFEEQLADLDKAVGDAPASPATEAKYKGVIASIHQARAAVPAAIRDSVPEVIRICADTIEAASGEYGESVDKGRIANLPEYHDSRGFIAYVAQQVAEMEKSHTSGDDASLISRFKTVLAKAQAIVGPLLPPERPQKSVADYRAIAHEAHALVSH